LLFFFFFFFEKVAFTLLLGYTRGNQPYENGYVNIILFFTF